jgi:hypothetical protein
MSEMQKKHGIGDAVMTLGSLFDGIGGESWR